MSAIIDRIVGVETEYGIAALTPTGASAVEPEVVARVAFRPVAARYGSTNVFLPNAGRLYLDVGAHPEFATPECRTVSELIAVEAAGDRIVDKLGRRAEEHLRAQPSAAGDERVSLFKNNVDFGGNSYGCHENYLVTRDVPVKRLGHGLLPFLISRQLLCGAGRIAVGPGTGEQGGEFRISQRADFVWESVSSATTRSRPIINTRDEPHADSHRFRRLHVIVGDSNMSQVSAALKVGSTLLVLEMLEAGWELPAFGVNVATESIRQIARHRDGSALIQLDEGRTMSALDVQKRCLEQAHRWLEIRPATDESNTEMARVVAVWQRVVDAVSAGNLEAIASEVDWVAKYLLLEAYRQRLGVDWADPKLRQIDVTYHDIRADRGIARLLEAKGRLARWVDEEAIARAEHTAPTSTRAHLRGRFLAAAEAAGADHVSCDWMRLKIGGDNPEAVELADPFVTVDPGVDALIGRLQQLG